MFGPKLHIEFDGLGITLLPPKPEWAAYYAEMMSSLKVNMWTMGLYGYSESMETEWLEKQAKDPESVCWAILPDRCDMPVGNTSLHNVRSASRTCTSGINIFDTGWWGRGVASRAHLIRTWYAADMLNRLTIQSFVSDQNEASRKALERAGYTVTGRTLRSNFRHGKYTDLLILSWLHPEWIPMLYPSDLPAEYCPSVRRAAIALEKARKLVEIL